VDPHTFQLDVESAKRAHTSKTKAVIPVHLFGQCADMSSLMEWAENKGLWVIEDNAQSLGSTCFMPDPRAAGAIGHLGTTSFFPSKNLGCMGDGGAVLIGNLGRQMDRDLANKVRCIANHGSTRKYHHTMVGINSRLDTLQAAFLNVKLNHWSDIVAARQAAAMRYDQMIDDMNSLGREQVERPRRSTFSDHLFHQYCVLLPHGVDRNQLQAELNKVGVASMVYYPTPLSSQPAFATLGRAVEGGTPCAHDIANRILALPMHTELTATTQTFAIDELFRLLPSTLTKSSGLDTMEAANA
jgi:dTDP-4-amino-4,6-dideoxygalactose transaminase